MSEMHSHTLQWIGIEMLTVGSISFIVAGFLYFGVTKLIRRGQEEEVQGNPENESTDNGSEPSNEASGNRPFSSNRRSDRESSVSFADDVDNNNPVDRRVPRFR